MPFDVGDVIRVTGTFKTAAGALLDPGTVTFKFKAPRATVVTYVYGTDAAVVKDGVGLYHVDLDATVKGEWKWRWASTGSGQAAVEGKFTVRPSSF